MDELLIWRQPALPIVDCQQLTSISATQTIRQMSDNALEAIALRRSRSLTAIVQKELEWLTISGEIRSGERLNEQAFAQRFGISRGPIREARDELADLEDYVRQMDDAGGAGGRCGDTTG